MKETFASCPCSGKNLDKMVKPAIMAVLAGGPLHGYAILSALGENGFFAESEKPDPSGVYRILKDMETQEQVTTEWDLASSGPARRVYTLTEAGVECLRTWDETLEKYQQRISHIRDLIGKALTE